MADDDDPEVSNDSDRTDAALDELILAAREVREVYVVLESHVQSGRAGPRGSTSATRIRRLPGQADVDRAAAPKQLPGSDKRRLD